ncbi:metallophosphoesterase [Thiohalobacter sp. IOR34]|uniref:metallophosphoesterase n=1 Tax=Thiohalobacter sp. IOR34 TaxID=3057176 RepID=UPI0025B24B88|nr:metallophosphoesterase [Thiohalobacter sp. IOR34]WJW75557.1 metallophosphoesterase [Thiohalobacter sp. IOR34]
MGLSNEHEQSMISNGAHKAYDIVGDIHGCYQSLVALLDRLGYVKDDGVYRHVDRKMIFLGDFIDRGPAQHEVIDTVRRMIEAGTALAVMGNHEFNAIAYASPDPKSGNYLRPHSDKNRRQHQAFLEAYVDDSKGYAKAIEWFKTLPLWLDLGNLRVVHACWDSGMIRRIEDVHGSQYLYQDLLYAASQRSAWQFGAIETILKGKEIPLGEGASFRDKDGNRRHHIRVRWWDKDATTYRQAFMGPESVIAHIPEDDIGTEHLLEYAHDEPPLFFGHYWLEGELGPLTNNIACVDYSVAKPGGRLVAYRWNGERVLSKDRFVWVDRQEVA